MVRQGNLTSFNLAMTRDVSSLLCVLCADAAALSNTLLAVEHGMHSITFDQALTYRVQSQPVDGLLLTNMVADAVVSIRVITVMRRANAHGFMLLELIFRHWSGDHVRNAFQIG